MRNSFKLLIAGLFLGAVASRAGADAKVDITDVEPAGSVVGLSVSPHGLHTAALAVKGSHYVMYMDGVAGPTMDQLCNGNGTGFNANSQSGWIGQVPVVFIDDGSHWAYMYKSADDTVIMYDGKEVGRLRVSPSLTMQLNLSKNGQHYAWATNDTIFVDGKPGPKTRFSPQLYFSPDGNHYAYAGTDIGSNNQFGFVDGNRVGYFGDIVDYSALNHLVAQYHDTQKNAYILVLDGKPAVAAANFNHIWLSPDGKQIAMLITPTPNAKTVLTVNGKIIPDTEGIFISQVYFSPDGKRFAAKCSTSGGSQYMIIDGKKGDLYRSISDGVGLPNYNQMQWAYNSSDNKPKVPAFTSDSSKFVYVSTAANNSNYLVTEDGEVDDLSGTSAGLCPAIAPSGNHFGFIGQVPNHHVAIFIDGKIQVLNSTSSSFMNFTYSPDGSRYAFTGDNQLWVDGKPIPGGTATAQFIFSPDGKHIAYTSNGSGLIVDGKILEPKPSFGNISWPLFSPDSQHIYYMKLQTVAKSTDQKMLYLDGKPVTHFTDQNLQSGISFYSDITKDGTVTIFARVDNTIKKVVVTPAVGENLTTALATAKSPPQQ